MNSEARRARLPEAVAVVVEVIGTMFASVWSRLWSNRGHMTVTDITTRSTTTTNTCKILRLKSSCYNFVQFVQMANLIRSAKSGSDWLSNELLAYNITVQIQDATEFFGHELGPIDHLDPNLFSSVDPTIATNFSKETYRFLCYLDLASRPNAGQECAIDDLAKSVLKIAGFDELDTILRSRYAIPFICCGEDRTAKSDICLVHLSSLILLVVQEDKTTLSSRNSEPLVIAQAIATFQHNNRKRMGLNLPLLDKMTIPCITLVGTRPFFYKVPVTQQLSNCVETGQYPSEQTVVTRCAPPARRRAEGMEVPDYRRVALQYYDAFRAMAKDCWTAFLDGWN